MTKTRRLDEAMTSSPRALCSKRWIARAFGLSENTIGKKLKGIEPDGFIGPNQTAAYRIATVAQLLVVAGDRLETDPAKMSPTEQIRYYQAQSARLEFDQRGGKLVAVEDLSRAVLEAAKMLAESLEGMPDAAQRKLKLTNKQAKALEKLLDAARGAYVAKLKRLAESESIEGQAR